MSATSHPRWSLYDIVMLCYLIGGLICLPMIVGESIVEMGWARSVHESNLPKRIFDMIIGYEILLMFGIVTLMIIAWIPALFVCYYFRRHWRVLVPAILLIVTDIAFSCYTARLERRVWRYSVQRRSSRLF